MEQSYVLDSNILIYHFEGDAHIRDTLDQWFSKGIPLFISSITRIEVLAAPALLPEEERLLQQFLSRFFLSPVDARIADLAASIRRNHRLKLGDSIIASSTILLNATLVTRNIRDFKRIADLKLYSL